MACERDTDWIRRAGLEDLELRPLPLDPGRDLPRVRSEYFGVLWAPDTLEDLGHLFDVIGRAKLRVGGWRGQADITSRLDSGAVRRVRRSADYMPPQYADALQSPHGSEVPLAKAVAVYERQLLNAARLSGHAFVATRKLGDLELLALLQHHGAATQLLDFSRSAMVALWFAANERSDVGGLLVGIRDPDDIDLLRAEQLEQTLDEVLPSSTLLLWPPESISSRMPAQRALLVSSPIVKQPWGSFGPADPSSHASTPPLGAIGRHLLAIAVSPALKAAIVEASPSVFGVEMETMFPDIDGFCRWNAVNEQVDRRTEQLFSELEL